MFHMKGHYLMKAERRKELLDCFVLVQDFQILLCELNMLLFNASQLDCRTSGLVFLIFKLLSVKLGMPNARSHSRLTTNPSVTKFRIGGNVECLDSVDIHVFRLPTICRRSKFPI